MRLGLGPSVCYSINVSNDTVPATCEQDIWGPYPNYDDIARFEYGRRLWKYPDMRARFLAHWLDERHPHRERFLEQRELIEEVLASPDSPAELQRKLLRRGTSVRCVAREIPPIFGSFFADSLKEPKPGAAIAPPAGAAALPLKA